MFYFFFFQAEDGIRDAQESRGLGDVYKRQVWTSASEVRAQAHRRCVPIGPDSNVATVGRASWANDNEPLIVSWVRWASCRGARSNERMARICSYGMVQRSTTCLLYTSDAADEEDSVDL